MAVAFGAALGSGIGTSPDNSWTLTTTGVVPAGGLVVVAVGWFHATFTETVSGGGLTWTRDKTFSSSSRNVAIWSAPAPAGLASSTVLTVTMTGNVNTCGAAACYLTGADTAVDATGTGGATSNTWSASVTTTVPDTLIVKFGWVDFIATSATPDATVTEWADLTNPTDTNTFEGVYRAAPTTTTYTPGGQWTGVQPWVAAAVAYKAAPAVASVRSTGQVVSTGSVTSSVVPLPTGWQIGDVCYLFCVGRATAGSFTGPAGWATVQASFASSSSTSSYMAVYRRILQSGDTDPTVTSTSGRVAIASVAVRDAVTSGTPEDASANDANGAASTSITAPSLTTLTNTNDLLLCAFGWGDPVTANVAQTVTPPGGFTEVIDIGTGIAAQTDGGVEVASKLLASSASTGTQTATCSASVDGMGVSVAVKSAAGGGGGALAPGGSAGMFDSDLAPGGMF